MGILEVIGTSVLATASATLGVLVAIEAMARMRRAAVIKGATPGRPRQSIQHR
jgi:hypothetical protein